MCFEEIEAQSNLRDALVVALEFGLSAAEGVVYEVADRWGGTWLATGERTEGADFSINTAGGEWRVQLVVNRAVEVANG